MQVSGRVQNGVVVLDGGVSLPEGTRVVVSSLPETVQGAEGQRKRVQLPLVASGKPGSVALTNERIYEILDEKDVEAVKRSWNVPS